MAKFKRTTALGSWSGKYPKIYGKYELDGKIQELLHREIFQGDEKYHWFCSCEEFRNAARTQIAGTLSNIANQLPLECSHVREIMREKGMTENELASV